MDLRAERLKEMLTMEDVLRKYGFETSPSGRIPCPLHDGHDKNFSYKGGRFKCFVCGEGGSVIDFTMRLFGLSFRQAVLRLDTDFSLGLTGAALSPARRREARALAEARRAAAQRKAALERDYRRLAEEHRGWWEVRRRFAPEGVEDLRPIFCEALRRLPELEWRLEELENEMGG